MKSKCVCSARMDLKAVTGVSTPSRLPLIWSMFGTIGNGEPPDALPR